MKQYKYGEGYCAAVCSTIRALRAQRMDELGSIGVAKQAGKKSGS